MLTRKAIEKLWEDAHPRYRWDLLSMRERECAERFARLVEARVLENAARGASLTRANRRWVDAVGLVSAARRARKAAAPQEETT